MQTDRIQQLKEELKPRVDLTKPIGIDSQSGAPIFSPEQVKEAERRRRIQSSLEQAIEEDYENWIAGTDNEAKAARDELEALDAEFNLRREQLVEKYRARMRYKHIGRMHPSFRRIFGDRA